MTKKTPKERTCKINVRKIKTYSKTNKNMKPQVKTLKDGYEAPTITSFAMSLEAGFCISGLSNEKVTIDRRWIWDDEPVNE